MYQMLCLIFYMKSLIYSHKVGTILEPTLQVGNLRPKEGKQHACVLTRL